MFITCAAVLLHQIRHLVKLISINIAISVQVEHFKCNFEMSNKSGYETSNIRKYFYLLEVDNTVRRKI